MRAKLSTHRSDGDRELVIRRRRGDPGDRGVPRCVGHPHDEEAFAVDRARVDTVAGGLVDGDRFAGDRRLVDAAGAIDDLAVSRETFARADVDAVSDGELGGGDVMFRGLTGGPATRR